MVVPGCSPMAKGAWDSALLVIEGRVWVSRISPNPVRGPRHCGFPWLWGEETQRPWGELQEGVLILWSASTPVPRRRLQMEGCKGQPAKPAEQLGKLPRIACVSFERIVAQGPLGQRPAPLAALNFIHFCRLVGPSLGPRLVASNTLI